MNPIYTHDCDKCIFLGIWRKPSDFVVYDLYVCESFTNLPSTNCVARFGNEGPEYNSMTLENPMWRSSLAHISGPRRYMDECYMPELCEAWRRWAEREGLSALPTLPDPHSETEATWKAHVEAEIEKRQHRLLADAAAVLDLRKMAMTSPYGHSTFWPTTRGTVTGRMKSSEPEIQFFEERFKKKEQRAWAAFDYRELELRILTADGYTFTEKPDGSVTDGDLTWPSVQAFIDDYKKEGLMRDFLYPHLRTRLEALGWVDWSRSNESDEALRCEKPIPWLIAQLEKARAHKPVPTIERIDTVRRALLAAARVSREESRDMTTQEVAEQVLNQLMEGEFDEPK